MLKILSLLLVVLVLYKTPDLMLTIKGGGIGFDGYSANKKLYALSEGVLEGMLHDLAAEYAFAVSHQGIKRVYLNNRGNSYLIGGTLVQQVQLQRLL